MTDKPPLAFAIITTAFIASPAMAQDRQEWGNGASYIQLQPTKAPGAFAEVEFHNEAVHSDNREAFTLSLGGFSVQVDAVLGRGATPDDMTVTVPQGFIAVPPMVSVPEGETRVITIYSTTGAGV